MTWLATTATAATPLGEVLALRPELAVLTDEYLAEIWAACDPLVLELCRLRIAQLLGDDDQQRLRHDAAVAAGLSEAQVVALPRHHDDPAFTAHQRACLAYAEQYVVDVHGLTDADAQRVRTGMSAAEFVAFSIALGMFDGLGRLRLALGVIESTSTEPPSGEPLVVAVPAAGSAAH